jgi:hypothetical protein
MSLYYVILNNWSWDAARWELIESKRTLSECATDGIIPNLLAVDRQAMLNKALNTLKSLTNRAVMEAKATTSAQS